MPTHAHSTPGEAEFRFRTVPSTPVRRAAAWPAGALLLAATALTATPARSQTLDQFLPPDVAGVAVEPDVTVASRLRPAYDGLGIRAGAFLIRPSATESAGYETNVLGTSTPRGSPIFTTSAALSAATDQSRGNFSTSVSVNDIRYTSQPSQSHTDWSAGLNGAYYLGRDILAVNYSHSRQAQTLQDLGVSQFLSQALPYQIDDGRVSYRTEFGRTFVVPTLEVTNYKFNSGLANGVVYQQGYRNNTVVQPSVTVGYELAPRRNLIAVLREGIAHYPIPIPGSATRDYKQTTALAGIDYDVSGVVRVRALVGYQSRNFDAAQFKTIQGPVTEGTLVWNITGLTTATATISRSIQDSSDVTTGAVTETAAKLRLDHELYRNVLVQGNAGLAVDEYPSSGSQLLYTAGVGATYLANRNMSVGATYDFSTRQSNASGISNFGATGQTFSGNYTDHRIQLQLRLRL